MSVTDRLTSHSHCLHAYHFFSSFLFSHNQTFQLKKRLSCCREKGRACRHRYRRSEPEKTNTIRQLNQCTVLGKKNSKLVKSTKTPLYVLRVLYMRTTVQSFPILLPFLRRHGTKPTASTTYATHPEPAYPE